MKEKINHICNHIALALLPRFLSQLPNSFDFFRHDKFIGFAYFPMSFIHLDHPPLSNPLQQWHHKFTSCF